MADSADSPLTPTKTSTVANLLTGAQTKIASFFGGSTSGAAKAADSSSSLLTSPLLWGGALLAALAVWFLKFRKPARKGTSFKRR